MNLLSSFGDFYYGLSSDGLFFFWIIMFLLCFLIFLTVILTIKNKKLIKLLNNESDGQENTIVDEIPVIEKKEEIINKNSEPIVEDVKIEEPIILESKEVESIDEKKDDKGPYKKNVLREMNDRMQTSPISISKNDVIYNSSDSYGDDYGLDEVYFREESVSPLDDMEDSYEVNDSMIFANEILERMEEEIKPSNIELTDYEKKQEEEAIISYDELLKVKDKIYNLTEDEETDEVIDQLKSFRLDL